MSYTVEMKRFQRPQRIKECIGIFGINGFIVNVHDATNYDIDLDIPENLIKKYKNVISNKYTYKDVNYGSLDEGFEIEKIGNTYRCRLKGIGINHYNNWNNIWKQNQISIEIKQLIDRTDGWVTCNIYNVDIYKRLLIDVIVNTPDYSINLKDFILEKSKNEHDPIFYQYIDKPHLNQ